MGAVAFLGGVRGIEYEVSLSENSTRMIAQKCGCLACCLYSSEKKAFNSHSLNLSLPLGEMSRSDREGLH